METHYSLITSHFVLLLALIFTGNALATEQFHERLYFGLGVAQSDLQLNNKNIATINNLSPQSSLENSGFGAQAFVGIEFDEHIALELGFTDIGKINTNDGSTTQAFMEANSTYVDAVLTQRINSGLDVFVQTGISFWQTTNIGTGSSSDGNGMHYGAGLNINIFGDNNRMLRVKWEYQEFDNIIIKSSDTISASILFTF